MKVKCLIFVCWCFSSSAHGMLFPQHDRSLGMPAWEQNRLNALAVQYDGVGSTVGLNLTVGMPGHFTDPLDAQFVQQFVRCARTGAVEYAAGVEGNPMDQILLAHAQNSVGRELMYRIMAKLEPRIECVNSIRVIITHMDLATRGNFADSVNVCANFLVNLGLVRNDNVANFMADLRSLVAGVIDIATIFNGLLDNPVTFVSNNAFQTTDGYAVTNQVDGISLTVVHDVLNAHANRLHDDIEKIRFRLIYDPNSQDQYNPGDNAVTITNQVFSCNLVTGPILYNSTEYTYVETRWQQRLGASSTLNHELGHYFRMGLEGIVSDPTFFGIATALSGVVSGDYITHLADVWDDTEEFTSIFGPLYLNGQIWFDRLNQSEFNLAGDPNHVDGVIYSHRRSRFHVVPYRLFAEIFGRGGPLPISDKTMVYYDKPIASI